MYRATHGRTTAVVVMKVLLLPLVVLITAMSLTASTSGDCEGVGSRDIRMHADLSVMMDSTEMRCADMNQATQRRMCVVLSEDDQRHILCGVNGRHANSDMSPCMRLCPDGSRNRTCFSVSDGSPIQLICLCHSLPDHQIYPVYRPTATQASWSPWQRLPAHNKSFDYTRELYTPSECLLHEYESFNLVNIIDV